jgi:hypothetical protein
MFSHKPSFKVCKQSEQRLLHESLHAKFVLLVVSLAVTLFSFLHSPRDTARFVTSQDVAVFCILLFFVLLRGSELDVLLSRNIFALFTLNKRPLSDALHAVAV